MSWFFFVKCNEMILLWFNIFIPGLNIIFLFLFLGTVLFDNDFETKYEEA